MGIRMKGKYKRKPKKTDEDTLGRRETNNFSTFLLIFYFILNAWSMFQGIAESRALIKCKEEQGKMPIHM